MRADFSDASHVDASRVDASRVDASHDLVSYDWAIIRVVPRVENGEGFNVGVVLFCSERAFLDARIECDQARWKLFAPNLDCELLENYLRTIPLICAGGKNAGSIGQMTQRERFHWLVAPRSTIIQTSVAHCGLCLAPEVALNRLFEKTLRFMSAE